MFHSFQPATRIKAFATALAFACALPSQYASAIEVVATIKPLHALASSVMKGVGEPHLLVPGNQSPHTHSLRPSDAKLLENADIIFYIDPTLETPLMKPIESLGRNAHVVELANAEGVMRLPYRDPDDFGHDKDHHDHDHDDHAKHESESHDDHKHDDEHHAHKNGHGGSHDDHGHEEEHHDHGDNHAAHKAESHDEHAHSEEEHHDDHGHDEHGHEGHHHGEYDAHVWLDPLNAIALVHAIAEELSEVDPVNAVTYRDNAEKTAASLNDLTEMVAEALKPARNIPFIVFHDAYYYFENRFGLTSAGAAVVNPHTAPGVKRVRKLQKMIRERDVVCVFDEPQFNKQVIEVVVEGTTARIGTVDPLGSIVEDGPDFYSRLIWSLANSFKNCLLNES